MEKMLKRSEVPENLKWDLTHLYRSEKELDADIERLKIETEKFKEDFDGKMNSSEMIAKGVREYEQIMILSYYIGEYVGLSLSVDMTNSELSLKNGKTNMILAEILAKVSFFESQLSQLDSSVITDAKELAPEFSKYFDNIIAMKPHMLKAEVEEALSALSPVLELPSELYENNKQMDIKFDNFTAAGKEYEMSYVKFENEYAYAKDNEVRRKAYEEFYLGASKHQHSVATAYNGQVQKEKILANLRGFDSVTDYLLFSQEIPREVYDRHLDIVMKELGPVIRRFAKVIAKNNNLDKITFADLKLPVYSDFSPKVSIDEARGYIKNSLSVLGDEYLSIALKYEEEKWVDWAQNVGKSTGGFCSSPFRKHPVILLSWTNLLSEVYTLIHEIGHGVHFILSDANNTLLTNDPSLALVEAPSTFNEMMLTNYITKNAKSEIDEKHAVAFMIENTYYHNFVTHFLEADYQRKVYNLVDKGETVNANILNDLMMETYKNFFGDEIDLTGADLTWIRQPHYYNGLYSYTYSVGLTVATAVYQKIAAGEEGITEKWIDFLKAGGTLNPVEQCKIVGVDLTSDKPVRDAIDFISKSVEKLEK